MGEREKKREREREGEGERGREGEREKDRSEEGTDHLGEKSSAGLADVMVKADGLGEGIEPSDTTKSWSVSVVTGKSSAEIKPSAAT